MLAETDDIVRYKIKLKNVKGSKSSDCALWPPQAVGNNHYPRFTDDVAWIRSKDGVPGCPGLVSGGKGIHSDAQACA